MQIRPFKLWVAAMALGCLFASTFLAGRVMAQASKLAWDKPEKITRVSKPNPRSHRRPRPRIEVKPYLTLEYRIIIESEAGSPIETSPNAIFRNGDRLQLRLKANQDGYLNIIQNSEGRDGEVVFPDRRINNGNNFVRRDQEIIIPSRCERKYMDERGNCYFEVDGPAGREFYTVIFSREAIPDALSQITVAGGVIKRQDIERIKKSTNQSTSRPNLSPLQGGGAGGYAIWVTNNNARNNEELIEKIVLNHKERERSNGK